MRLKLLIVISSRPPVQTEPDAFKVRRVRGNYLHRSISQSQLVSQSVNVGRNAFAAGRYFPQFPARPSANQPRPDLARTGVSGRHPKPNF